MEVEKKGGKDGVRKVQLFHRNSNDPASRNDAFIWEIRSLSMTDCYRSRTETTLDASKHIPLD